MEKKIIEIHTLSNKRLQELCNMSQEEALLETQKYVDMGKVMEDTVVFAPGTEILVDVPESRRLRMLGPDTSYRNIMLSNIDPYVKNNITNGKNRAENIINNLKHKKSFNLMFSLKSLLSKITPKTRVVRFK